MRCRFKSVIFLLSFLLLLGFPVELVGTNLRMSLLAQAQEERSQERREEALRLNSEGLQLFYIAQFREALEEIYQEEQETKAWQLNQEGMQLWNTGQFREALEKFEQALKIFQSLGNYQQALGYFQQSLKTDQEIGKSKGEGVSLNNIGLVYSSLGKYQQGLDYFQQSLKIFQEIGERSLESNSLYNIGVVYRSLGKYEQALSYSQQSLKIFQELGNLSRENVSLNSIGKIYHILARYQQALSYFQQALKISQESGVRKEKGSTLNNIGTVYYSRGEYQQALSYYQQALKISQELGVRKEKGTNLNNIGAVYLSLGQYQQALNHYQQALEILQSVGTQPVLGATLNSIGVVYHSLGEYQQALEYHHKALDITKETDENRTVESSAFHNIGAVYGRLAQYQQALSYYQQALKIRKKVGDRSGEATTLNGIGTVYLNLGQYQKALEQFQEAFQISEEIDDRSGEVPTLNNIGFVYESLGQYDQALSYYQQALKISQDLCTRPLEGTILNNIGTVYLNLGQYQKALEQFQKAFQISQELGDRSGKSMTLHNIGSVYDSLGQYEQALSYYQQALKVSTEVGERELKVKNLNNIAVTLKDQNQPELAILFLKQSVNTIESIRQDFRELPQDLQKSYEDTIAKTYRDFADLLIEQDRILEAQRVLDLLKLQEIEEFNRRGIRGNEDTRTGIELLSLETEIWKGYEQIFNDNNATQLGTELTNLRIIPATERTPTQKERIKELENLEQKLVQQLTEYLESNSVTEKVATLSQKAKEQSLDLKYLEILQDKLGKLDQNGMLLYPLVSDDRIELIITTLDKPPIRRTVNVTRIELNKAILEFREAASSTRKDPTIPGQKLYNWLIKPIEQDLIDANVQTIIYAPDRQLRYIPLAALHDGKEWLIERWRVNNITALSLTNLNQPPSQQPQVLAGATSIRHTVKLDYLNEEYDFKALNFVEKEVNQIKSMIPNTKVLINQDFTPTNTVPQMSKYQIVHFATHGKFVLGTPESSFILFGNGDIATLRDMEDWELQDVELVVLSACETALVEGGGAEILGLGYAIQKAGSRAAIATLWEVQDDSTETLMTTFYELLNNNPDITTAEALRQAQISLIESENNHPYYWSPFLLIGNGL